MSRPSGDPHDVSVTLTGSRDVGHGREGKGPWGGEGEEVGGRGWEGEEGKKK